MHYNLGKTLQDVENIVALPHEAAEAEDMLRDDTQLLQARVAYIGPGQTPSVGWRVAQLLQARARQIWPPSLSSIYCGLAGHPAAACAQGSVGGGFQPLYILLGHPRQPSVLSNVKGPEELALLYHECLEG